MAEVKILALAGSTRSDSYNKKLLIQAAEIARTQGAKVIVIDLKDFPMPFYDADLEQAQGMPTNAKKLRDLMIQSDTILIASPEYNGSISAVLKNALDWTSRGEKAGYSQEAFKGKQFALLSASPGGGGGARGLAHLRSVITSAGGDVISAEVSVPQAYKAFNAQGQLTSNELKQRLSQQIEQLKLSH